MERTWKDAAATAVKAKIAELEQRKSRLYPGYDKDRIDAIDSELALLNEAVQEIQPEEALQ